MYKKGQNIFSIHTVLKSMETFRHASSKTLSNNTEPRRKGRLIQKPAETDVVCLHLVISRPCDTRSTGLLHVTETRNTRCIICIMYEL